MPVSDTAPAAGETQSQPNLLLLVADDMGYTDLGAYGSEIRTPNIDGLAEQSIKLTNFHVAPTCAPTRSMILSGTDNHTAGLGSMFGRPMLSGVDGVPGYELYLHERVATLPEILSDAGYHTYIAGKWHLGVEPDQTPAARGFERSFVLIPGSWQHFGAPAHLFSENGEMVDESINDFYSTRGYTDKLIEYIGDNHGDDRPFFAFAAYTSPHWPLQVPDEFIDRYAGVYDEGYDVLREKRVESAQALGLVPQVDAEAGFERIGPAWQELSDEEQRVSARRMELYAAMLENLDHNIGRLLAYLEEIGELDNTVILFMSDNGAESDRIDLNPTFVQRWGPTADNSMENLGRANSFVSIGPGWAQAATAPFNRAKGFINEGGTRVPAFILYGSGVNPIDIDDQFLRAMDIAPTFLELAGTEPVSGSYRGREVVEIEGRSFARILDGNHQPLYSNDEAIGSELHGHRALRRGRYKLVWEQAAGNTWWDYPVPDSWYRWSLYDIESDPSESRDLSEDYPELVAEMIELWDDYADAHGVVREARLVDWERWHPAGAGD
jgi:arylsulfatase